MLNAQFAKYECYCPETRRNFPSIQAYQRWRWNREKKQLNNRWRREQGVKNRIAAKHAEYAHTIKELAIKQREQLAHDVAEANASHQDNKSRKNGKPMSSISGEIPHDCFVCTGAQPPPTHPPPMGHAIPPSLAVHRLGAGGQRRKWRLNGVPGRYL